MNVQRCGIETFLLYLWKKREWRGEPGEGVRLYSECGKAICAPLEQSILWSLDTWTNQSRGVFKITKRKKALRFFLNHSYFLCGNNQALYILYWLHSWLFGLTNISSHTLPSQPCLENTPSSFIPPLKTFTHFSMAAVFSVIFSSLGWCTYFAWGVGWEGLWTVGIQTWIRIWTL